MNSKIKLIGLAGTLGEPDERGFIWQAGCIPFCTTCCDWHTPCVPHSMTSNWAN